ncbi:hypothetical protein [Acetobacter malorum]|nr:hypothetical protein [Acetobacter malorum]
MPSYCVVAMLFESMLLSCEDGRCMPQEMLVGLIATSVVAGRVLLVL